MAAIIEFLLHNLWLPVLLLGLFVWIRLRRSKQAEPPPASAPASGGGLPRPEDVVAGMRVTRMLLTGHVKVVGPSGQLVEDLPRSPYGHGEMPEGRREPHPASRVWQRGR